MSQLFVLCCRWSWSNSTVMWLQCHNGARPPNVAVYKSYHSYSRFSFKREQLNDRVWKPNITKRLMKIKDYGKVCNRTTNVDTVQHLVTLFRQNFLLLFQSSCYIYRYRWSITWIWYNSCVREDVCKSFWTLKVLQLNHIKRRKDHWTWCWRSCWSDSRRYFNW